MSKPWHLLGSYRGVPSTMSQSGAQAARTRPRINTGGSDVNAKRAKKAQGGQSSFCSLFGRGGPEQDLRRR
eukprot:g62519.t1